VEVTPRHSVDVTPQLVMRFQHGIEHIYVRRRNSDSVVLAINADLLAVNFVPKAYRSLKLNFGDILVAGDCLTGMKCRS
jgi:hypothetical protein